MGKRIRQSGAVSLFAVIFAALLLTVLTVGFVKLMIREQMQATNNDLSQSAYDSALAGVEDAKRAVRLCSSGSSAAACAELEAPDDCKVVARAGVSGDPADNETIVQSNSGTGTGSDFDQAYTCVNIAMQTEDYVYTSSEGASELIPLKATGEISSIVLEWYAQRDAGVGARAELPAGVAGVLTLPAKADWGVNAPPLLRAQVITPGDSFSLGELDETAASRTAFLRPVAVQSAPATDVPIDLSIMSRATDGAQHSNTVSGVPNCTSNFSNEGYSCRVILQLPDDGKIAAGSETAFLRLNTIYKAATVRVSLKGSSATDPAVQFDGVQPKVDSTGRASSLFRRVEARLKIGQDFSYPNYAVDITNNLCKNFSVNADTAVNTSCDPTTGD